MKVNKLGAPYMAIRRDAGVSPRHEDIHQNLFMTCRQIDEKTGKQVSKDSFIDARENITTQKIG